MKNCNNINCKQINPQSLDNFRLNSKSKDGLEYECKCCKKIKDAHYRERNREQNKIRSKKAREKNPGAQKEWRKKNPKKFRANQKRFKDKNRTEIRKNSLDYYYKNRQKQLLQGKKRRDSNLEKEHKRTQEWRKKNPEKINERNARRRACKLKRTPFWLSESHKLTIKNIYKMSSNLTKETGIRYEVDHIIPLKGKNVSGLHVPWNLQVLEKSIHILKGNRVIEKDLESHKTFLMNLINKKPLT